MTLVLDTSILIDLENRQPKTIADLEELITQHQDPAKITFITEFEFLFGLKDKNISNKTKSLTFLNKFSVLHTTKLTAPLLADLKQKYQKKGINLPLADLLIATLCIENHFTLLTKDPDFEPIEELNKIII